MKTTRLACALIRAENDDRKGAEGKSTETQVDADAAPVIVGCEPRS